jgi:cytochrome bd-type quinol oxidase subunit 1
MHLLHSTSTIFRMRFAALLWCARYLLPLVTCALLAHSLITSNLEYAIYGVYGIILTAVASISQWLVAARTRCPLCMTSVLAKNHCAKHHRARSFLGSYRLPVVLSILFKNEFLCPYCNERTALELHKKHHRSAKREIETALK